MRTLLNEVKQIDAHLLNTGSTEARLLFGAMLIIDPSLQERESQQRTAHTFIRQYGRKKIKAEIEAVHQQLFTESRHKTFRQKILNFFAKDP
jgi:hypothetical protein